MAKDLSMDNQITENKTNDIHPHLIKLENNNKPAEIVTKSSLKRSATESNEISIEPHLRSPTKKIRLQVPSNHQQSTTDESKTIATPGKFIKKKFVYGNYNRYYGYRNKAETEDVRIVAFHRYMDFFKDADILDIGCNYGNVTVKIAKNFPIKSIVGLDIDKDLIAMARKRIVSERKALPKDLANTSYPFNIKFNQCNYVISDESLLALETEQFDTILCLSVTKWVHLNFGDAGLKMAFKRMYRQLRPGGRLILEPQDWKSYKKRKNLTNEIRKHYQNIKLFPCQFQEYLLSLEVGFEHCFEMERRQHEIKGFRRPIYVFEKSKPKNKENTTVPVKN